MSEKIKRLVYGRYHDPAKPRKCKKCGETFDVGQMVHYGTSSCNMYHPSCKPLTPPEELVVKSEDEIRRELRESSAQPGFRGPYGVYKQPRPDGQLYTRLREGFRMLDDDGDGFIF